MEISKRVLTVLATVVFTITASISGAQATLLRPKEAGSIPKEKKIGESEKKKDYEKPREVEPGVNIPVLWQDPGAVESLNLFYGPGGQAGAPNPTGKFTYVKDQPTGTQKKIVVKDEQGRVWTVKFGPEAKPETAAARIVWAVGYHAHQDYFVKEARIEGYSTPVIHEARFQRRDDGYKTVGNWDWEANPFVGEREFEGLKALMALLDNWDLKALNNKVERPQNKEDKRKLIYFVSDLGATFGRTKSGYAGIPFTGDVPADHGPGKQKAKGNPEAYASEKFIHQKRDGSIKFYLARARGRRILKDVSVEDARWVGGLLSRLSVEQLSDALRAGGYSDNEAQSLVDTMRKRIQMLNELK